MVFAAAGIILGGKAIGGDIVATATAILVVCAGAWFARLPASDTYIRELQKKIAQSQDLHLPEDALRERTRRDRLVIGAVVVAAGGIWLVFAIAAL